MEGPREVGGRIALARTITTATPSTVTETAKLNDVDPQAWLADVLARLPDHPAKHIDELLPWRWKASRLATTMAQAA